MSNDDHTLGAVLTLVVGGAAGYAAGRWLVEPWIATRAGRSVAIPAKTTPHRSLAAGPLQLYAGPSGEMKPIDPYADDSSSVVVTAPSVVTASPTPPVAVPVASSMPAQPDGPITSPAQVDSSIAPARTDGPIMSPAQLAVTPSSAPVASPSTSPTQLVVTPRPSSSGEFATSAGVRRFDPVFERYRGSVPLAYVRALVERESDGRPSVRAGSAVGLMQIVPVVLVDYNKRHGTAYQSDNLVEPATNVAIGCELLRLIIGSYRKNHPRVPNLQPDWSNPRFVELLTLGWNAGFSEAGGLGRVARYLEQLGALDITIDQVSAHAKLAGATKHLSNPAKVAWCKSVVALYQRERSLAGARAALAIS